MPLERSEPLLYSIAGASSQSGSYVPQNILIDNPADPSSRWSGASTPHGTPTWLLLRLDSLAILKSITLGKLNKLHACNMKEFKVYVGTSEDNMSLVLNASLKNDTIPETFSIPHTNDDGVEIPTRYVKLAPVSPHNASYHASIWYVAMTGIRDKTYVETVYKRYTEYTETIVLRLALKHLRQRRLLSPYQAILDRSGLRVEHPLVSELFDLIVVQGKWLNAEELLVKMGKANLFKDYLQSCQPHAIWERLDGSDEDGDVPCARGGHAMCIDSAHGIIYLFGGYDGKKSLDDFWSFNIKANRWTLLCSSTTSVRNAPDARACHKMVFDSKTGSIYVFGRLGDGDIHDEPRSQRDSSTPRSEFYRYHTRGADKDHWDYLAVDTESSGGPPLIFDHQMVMDSDAQIIYVFGGKIVDEEKPVRYSSFYSYNVRLSKWKHIPLVDSSGKQILSRFGHSMILEPTTRTLFIFAGQRDDRYLSDMYAYDISSNTTKELFSNFTASGGPNALFTQRAVIDPQLQELYIFCGLTRASRAGAHTTLAADQPTWVFRYASRRRQWMQVLQGSQLSAHHSLDEPVPRYAHQVVYDSTSKTAFMHGGNAGMGPGGSMERSINMADDKNDVEKDRRLDDFWKMTLVRPAASEVLRKAKFQIRQQQFREMSETMPQIQALAFLQGEVASVVDHSDAAETEIFRSLLTHLLTPRSPTLVPKTYPSEHEDSPPRKRSRANTPEDDAWTNDITRIAPKPRVTGMEWVDPQALRSVQDPLEPGGEEMGEERFRQRSELFETLLEYVSAGAKQPDGSLMNLISLGIGLDR